MKNYDESFFRNVIKGNTVTFLIAPYIQAFGMRQLFPCWDISHLKATFAISIKHHRKFITLSNMPIKYSTHFIRNDEVWNHFYTTPPMSTLQIAIVMMNRYQPIRISENITLWCECYSDEQSLKFEFAQRIINNITLHLKSEFNEINIPKMDHIVIPNFLQDGISKWGIIFHTEANLIYDKKLDSVMRKMEIARLIASKIAYQWFSNILSINWWSHFWLHDGFATMFGEEAVIKSFNNSEILDLFIIQNQYESLHLDSHFNMNPVEITDISDINSIFNFPRYMKVIILLRMYQNILTDEVFRSNIHTYVSEQTFSSITSYNFWSMKKELDGGYHCNASSNEFLTWIQYEHYPVINSKRNITDYGVKYILSQHYNTTNYSSWLIPINLEEIFLKESYKICLSSYIQSIIYTIFRQNSYRMVDIQQAGYYRVKYDSLTWDAIAKYANDTDGDYKNINVINRAKIIDDAFHLTMERQLNVSLFWNLTQYFYSHETNFVVWYPLLKVFEYISFSIPLLDRLKKLLENPLKTLGYDEHFMENDLTKCLRQEIVKWACILEYDNCEQTASRKLQQHLRNPKINPLLPEWKHWTYCNGLAIANSSTWSYVKDIWLKTRNPSLLLYLTCSGYGSYSDIASLSFFELFTQDEKQDITFIRLHIDIFHSVIMKHSKTFYILEKILTVLKTFKPE
ncbi:AMPE aminopeptidase, partial [Acromyrmex heyeri]